MPSDDFSGTETKPRQRVPSYPRARRRPEATKAPAANVAFQEPAALYCRRESNKRVGLHPPGPPCHAEDGDLRMHLHDLCGPCRDRGLRQSRDQRWRRFVLRHIGDREPEHGSGDVFYRPDDAIHNTATDRIIDQFREGEALADWSFPPPEWDAFLTLEQARRMKGRWWIVGPVIVGPIAVVLAITGWPLAHDMWVKIAIMVLVAGASAAVFWLVWQLFRVADRRHLAMMRRDPRVLIKPSAIYCGGVLTLWDVGMTVLQGIRTVAGSPMMLEVTTGASRTASTAVGVTSIVTGGISGAAANSNMAPKVLVPVPHGREEAAAHVAEALLQPPGPAA